MMTETVVNVQDAPNSNNAANKQSQGHGLEWIKLNVQYFMTLPGILKLLQLLCGILCMALATPIGYGGTHFFLVVATISFIATLIWVFVYFLGIREATSNFPINWILTELLNTGIVTIFYFIAFIVQISIWAGAYYYRGVNLAAGVFGIFNTVFYGAGAYLLYIEHKNRS